MDNKEVDLSNIHLKLRKYEIIKKKFLEELDELKIKTKIEFCKKYKISRSTLDRSLKSL